MYLCTVERPDSWVIHRVMHIIHNESLRGERNLNRNFTRIMSLILAICLIGGVVVSIFAVWPVLLPILLVAGGAGYLIWRRRRGDRGKKRN